MEQQVKVERIVEEYLKNRALLESLKKVTDEYKEMLTKVIDEQGEPDEKGHKWFHAGRFMLKRQKSQGDPYLNKEKAEAWARERGIWDDVKIVQEVLNEDAIIGYVWDHKDEPGLEASFKGLYETPAPTWSFIKPVEEEQYDL